MRVMRDGGLQFGALMLILLALIACSPALDFKQYRACVERNGSHLHDPGTVMWQELGDDGRQHFGILADRHRDDPRQIRDVAEGGGVRVNRFCTLVTGAGLTSPFSGRQQ